MNNIIQCSGITLVYVNQYIKSAFWETAQHSHDHAEIFIHMSGKMDILVENNIYHHNSNEIRIYAPGELHFGKCEQDQQMEWYQISLQSSYLKENPYLADFLINREKGKDNVFVSKKHSEIVALAAEIFEKKNNRLWEYYFISNITKILCILNEPCNNIKVEMGKNKSLQDILEILNEKVTDIHSTNDLCRLTHFSSSYIHYLFKKHLNTTPHKYILIKKLSKAKNMIAVGTSITNACYDSGFNDYANFITVFRKTFGVTPGNYKKKNNQN